MLDDSEPANIEIQTAGNETLFKRRVEYHVAHLLNHYVRKGDVWHDIPKTYQISIVDFIFDSDSDKYVSRYQMRTSGGRKLDERLNIIGKQNIAHRRCASETRISKGNSR